MGAPEKITHRLGKVIAPATEDHGQLEWAPGSPVVIGILPPENDAIHAAASTGEANTIALTREDRADILRPWNVEKRTGHVPLFGAEAKAHTDDGDIGKVLASGRGSGEIGGDQITVRRDNQGRIVIFSMHRMMQPGRGDFRVQGICRRNR